MQIAVDPADLSPVERHKMTIGTVVPRPIGWTSTVDPEGRVNLAPFSYFMGCHSYLPAVALSVGSRKDLPGQPKDTAANILATRQFVVQLVDEALAEAMNVTAAAFPPGTEEPALAGVTMTPSEKVAPPRVAEAPVAMECELLHSLTLGEAPRASTLIVGRILMWHVRRDLLGEGYKVDQAAIQPVARMGGPNYVHARDPWSMAIPDWRSVTPPGGSGEHGG